MDNLLQQGIAAAKAGNKSHAFQLLTRATQDTTLAELAWIWLSAVVEHDSERLFCLDNALRSNPNNVSAQRGASMLRQKGVFPSPPMPPDSKVDPVPSISSRPTPPQPSPSPVLQPSERIATPQPKQPTALPVSGNARQDLSGLYKFAAIELANKKYPDAIIKSLTQQGADPETAKRIVAETQQALNKARTEQYRKRMVRGLIWMVLGIIITCSTYLFADNLGGRFVLFWGAIIFGFIDFLVGLFGWLSNK